MASVAIFEPGQIPQYLPSVNTPDYETNPYAIVNPDLSLVSGVPTKYWKLDNGIISEMSQIEKDAITQAETDAMKARVDQLQANLPEVLRALVKVINIRLPAGSKITKEELIEAIKQEI